MNVQQYSGQIFFTKINKMSPYFSLDTDVNSAQLQF